MTGPEPIPCSDGSASPLSAAGEDPEGAAAAEGAAGAAGPVDAPGHTPFPSSHCSGFSEGRSLFHLWEHLLGAGLVK